MPDPKIELWSPTRFLPYGRNPRKNDHVVDQMVASIREFGFKVPMLARSTGEVVDGHLRLKAAIALGLEAIPTILCDEWSDAQVRAFRIMVNKSVEWADWDSELLSVELGELKDLNYDLTLTGFDLSEVDGLLAKSWEPPARESQKPQATTPEEPSAPTQGLTEDDATPEEQAEPATATGDLWVLGEHRVLCGDCTRADTMAHLMNGEKADMMFADPPYNQAQNREMPVTAELRPNSYGKLKGAAWDREFRFIDAANTILTSLADSCTVYVCMSEFIAPDVWAWMKEWSDYFCYCVWCKENPMPSLAKNHWTWATELIGYATRGKRNFNFPETGHALNWWRINVEQANRVHPTQKPVAVPQHAITHSSQPTARVLDPFLGSGSTLIACEKLSRACFGMELSPAYVDVIVTRWQNFTGKQATLEGDGRTFEQIREARAQVAA